jgi:hypothetical protein
MAKIETTHARAVRDDQDEEHAESMDMKVPPREATADTVSAIAAALRKWTKAHGPDGN